MVRASRGSSSVVKIAPRNSHEPNSRETRLVCLPCQPNPAAPASGFLHHGGRIDEHFHIAAGLRDQPARQQLQALLDEVMIVVAAGIDRDRGVRALLEDLERILVGSIIDAEHDDGAHVLPHHFGIGAAVRIVGKPLHVAMGAGIEKFLQPFAHAGDGVRIGDPD
jgi:hypothetical protein